MRNVACALRREKNKTDYSCDGERSDTHDGYAVDSPGSADRADGRRDPEVPAPEVVRGDHAQREVKRDEGEQPAGRESQSRSTRTIGDGLNAYGDGRDGETGDL